MGQRVAGVSAVSGRCRSSVNGVNTSGVGSVDSAWLRRLRGTSATGWRRCYALDDAAEPEVQRKCLIDGRGLSALWFCLDKHQTDAVWILDGCPSPQSGDIAGFRSDDSSEVGCDSGRSIKVGDANVRSPRWCVR
jgi:hypothetical protein